MKTIIEKFQTTDINKREELENFKNGDIEFDNQVDELNNKIIKLKFLIQILIFNRYDQKFMMEYST